MKPAEQIAEIIASLRILQRDLPAATSGVGLHQVDVIAHVGSPRVEHLLVIAPDKESAMLLAALHVPEGIRHRARVRYVTRKKLDESDVFIVGRTQVGTHYPTQEEKAQLVQSPSAESILNPDESPR